MRIVISGGTGLIGSALVESLTSPGAGPTPEVVILSRDPARVSGLPAGVRAERWDGRTAGPWAALVDGAGAIVHLAGESVAGGRWTARRKQQLRTSRIESGRALVEAMARAKQKPAIFLQGSAVGYYGPRGDEELPEETPPGNDFLASLCVEWEASTAMVEEWGVRRAILRTGIVLGTSGGALPRMLLPFRLFAGGPLGSGRQWFPWIHIADEVGAIRFLLDQGSARGPFNLCSPQPLRNRDFSRVLGKVLRRPSLLPAPAPALRLALGEMAEVLLAGQRAVPRRLLEAGYRFRFPEAEAALRDLLD